MIKIFNRKSEKIKRQNLRNDLPPAEVILWSYLKAKQLKGYKFRRQYSIGKYIVDFYCPILKLAIEIDGDSHFGKSAEEYNSKRQKFIESFGVRFLRFTNLDVYHNLEVVLKEISMVLP